MRKNRLTLLLIIAVFALGTVGVTRSAHRALAQEGNLLANPSFEGEYSGYTPRTAQEQEDCPSGFCSTVQTASGWNPWWVKERESDANPEYKPAEAFHAGRVHSGERAAQYFTFYRTHKAGLYQQVTVPSGASLRLTVMGQTWISDQDDPTFSDTSAAANMRVGIDPTGGANVYSPSIVWSDPRSPYDAYQQFSVDAQAQGDRVTVFLFAAPDGNPFAPEYGMKNTNIYWDDASLVVLGQAPPPPPPTAAGGDDGGGGGGDDGTAVAAAPPAAQPITLPTSTPDAEGIIYAEVQEGDSYWSIAARHGLTIDEIFELNGAEEGDFVQVGQLIVVGEGEPGGAEAEDDAGAEGEETPTPQPPTPTPPLPTATPAPVGGEVCLEAFIDANENGERDSGEELKPSVAFTIYDDEKVVINYVTNGSSEPYCITGLDAGSYRITRSSLSNEVLTTDGERVVAVSEGSSQAFAFGSYLEQAVAEENARMGDNGAPAAVSGETALAASSLADDSAAAADEGGIGRIVLIAAVVVAVLLFVGVLVLILSARRSTA